MNQNSTLTVRELARERTVLYLCSEMGGGLLNWARGRGRHFGPDRLARIAFGGIRPRRVEERLWVANIRGLPAIGPAGYPEPMRRRNARRFARVIGDWLDARGDETCLLLFHWWEVPEVAGAVPWAASAYNCSDDHASTPGTLLPADHVRATEGRLMDTVDRTWMVSDGLRERRADARRRIEVLPAPIDLRLFDEVTQGTDRLPAAPAGRPRPVIGYAGGLTDRMDWELLGEIAERRPDWTLQLVGGEATAAPPFLRDRPNVVFAGTVPYEDALHAIAGFDVGIIPVRVGEFSRGNSFLKLLDYAAFGHPIVATALPDTLAAAALAPGAIATPDGLEAWLGALDAAVAEPDDSPNRAARRRFAEARSNERRVATILAALEQDRADRVAHG